MEKFYINLSKVQQKRRLGPYEMFYFFLTLCFIVTKFCVLARLNSLIVIIVWMSNSSVCIWYEASKWNGKMLVKWLSDQFWRYWSYIYVFIETPDAEITASDTHLLHSYRDVQDSCLNQLLQLNIYRY